jgi:uncharacterized protein YbjT (DUF2867 family)
LDFIILQPASYMQNILGYVPAMRAGGIYAVPYSVSALFTPVDLADVAEVAASALIEESHRNSIYSLAGPTTLSSKDMAELVGRHLGVIVKATKQSTEEWQRGAQSLSEYAKEALIKMFAYYDAHGFVGNSLILKTLLGREPTAFEDFATRDIK